jgi:riboflavin synthase
MFTGIIECQGKVESRSGDHHETRLRLATPFEEVPARGESIAVDGVCLTAVAGGAGWFEAVVSPETLSRTTLGDRDAGDRVNIERALRMGDRLGGHLVQGHVDAVGRVEGVESEGSGARMRISFPDELAALIVFKGSVTVDGVSLTVASRRDDAFEVALIPETLEATGLGSRRAGDRVNLEVDVIGRYVVEAVRGRESREPAPVTRELLDRHGFAVKEVVP